MGGGLRPRDARTRRRYRGRSTLASVGVQFAGTLTQSGDRRCRRRQTTGTQPTRQDTRPQGTGSCSLSRQSGFRNHAVTLRHQDCLTGSRTYSPSRLFRILIPTDLMPRKVATDSYMVHPHHGSASEGTGDPSSGTALAPTRKHAPTRSRHRAA